MIRYSQKRLQQFCSKPLLDLIKDISNPTENTQDLQKALYRVYLFSEEHAQTQKEIDRNLLSASIASQTPVKSVLKTFEIYNKSGFDQDLLAKSCEYLGKAFKSYPEIRRVYQDLDEKEVLQNWRFQDLVKEVRYGLQEHSIISEENLSKIAQGLAQVGFSDREVQQEIFQKLLQACQVKSNFTSSEHQAHKAFYSPLEENVDLTEEVLSILQEEKEESQDELIQTTEEVKNILKGKALSLDQYSHLRQKVNAIEQIRNQYFTLVKARDTLKNLKEDHFLNLQLLELEEKLLAQEFINLDDIQNIQNFSNQDKNVQRVAQVLENYLRMHVEDYEGYIFYQKMAQQLENKSQNQKKQYIQEQVKKLNTERSIDYLSVAKTMKNLVQMSLNTQLVSQDNAFNYQSLDFEKPQKNPDVNFFETQQHCMSLYKHIPESQKKGLTALYLSHTLAMLRQGEPAKQLLETFIQEVDLSVLCHPNFELFIWTLLSNKEVKMSQQSLQKIQAKMVQYFPEASLRLKSQCLLVALDKQLALPNLDLFIQQLEENHSDILTNQEIKVIQNLGLLAIEIPQIRQMISTLPKIPEQLSSQKQLLQKLLKSLQNPDQEFQLQRVQRQINCTPDLISNGQVWIIEDREMSFQDGGSSYISQIVKKARKNRCSSQINYLPIWSLCEVRDNKLLWKNEAELFSTLKKIVDVNHQVEDFQKMARILVPLLEAELNFRNMNALFNVIEIVTYIGGNSPKNYVEIQKMKQDMYDLETYFNLLGAELQSTVNELCEKAFEQNFKLFLENQISHLTGLEPKGFESQFWFGKRLSQETAEQKQTFNPISLLNQAFLHDPNYVQYKSDFSLLEKVTLNNLSFVPIKSPTSALLLNKKVARIIPQQRITNQIRPIGTKLGQQEVLAGQYQKSLDPQTEFLVNIQNFKFEMKENPEKFIHLVTQLEFIETLFAFKEEPSQTNYQGLNRRAEDYFEFQHYLASLEPQEELHRYLSQAGKGQNQVKYLLSLKQDKLKKLYKVYFLQQHVISGKLSLSKYKQFSQQVNQALKQTLEQMDSENKTQNMVSYEANLLKTIEYKTQKPQAKTEKIDEMLILANGNHDIALEYKKQQALHKLMKARIIIKQEKNLPLSEKENSYLSQWNRPLTLEDKAPHVSIGFLSDLDANLLNELNFSQIGRFKKFKLYELILEMGHIISDNMLKTYDLKQKNWGINHSFITQDLSFTQAQQENELFASQSYLEKYEMQALVDLLKLERTQTGFLKKIHNEYEDKVIPVLEKANAHENRFEVMELYIQQKEIESKRQNFLGKKIMLDTMSEEYKMKLLDEIWQRIFKSEYEKTSQSQISTFVAEFCNRLYLLSLSPNQMTNSLIAALVRHQNISAFDKEVNSLIKKLVGMLEMYEIEPKFSAKEMESLIE